MIATGQEDYGLIRLIMVAVVMICASIAVAVLSEIKTLSSRISGLLQALVGLYGVVYFLSTFHHSSILFGEVVYF